jgi:hypothetical protein
LGTHAIGFNLDKRVFAQILDKRGNGFDIIFIEGIHANFY